MDYKEEYQKALERAKKGLPIDEVFPELKESEDERIREQIEQVLIEHDWSVTYKVRKGDCIAWLGKQKEQKPAEWSEKDKDMLLSAMEYIQTYPAHRQSVVDWLKNLPNRFCIQYKQEWSKEEKGILLECVTALQNSSHWLLADKLSSLSPQPQWKPSEEQIEALEWMLTTVSMKDGGRGVVLKNLINDLKKQM